MESRLGAALRPYFPLAAGVLINLSTGILYAWSVVVATLEIELDADRATVSGAQSLCLLTATIGCFVMHRLLHWFTLPQLTLVMGHCRGPGIALAGFGQSVAALYVGYGVVFGFAVGVVYFVAMTAASIDGPVRPSIAMSINMSAVAVGGIAWSPGLAILIAVGAGDDLRRVGSGDFSGHCDCRRAHHALRQDAAGDRHDRALSGHTDRPAARGDRDLSRLPLHRFRRARGHRPRGDDDGRLGGVFRPDPVRSDALQRRLRGRRAGRRPSRRCADGPARARGRRARHGRVSAGALLRARRRHGARHHHCSRAWPSAFSQALTP